MTMKEQVCVTGAGGYLASWLVKFLLEKGYIVHGTVRNPGDEKNAHLKKLENAAENLKLFKADLLDYDGLCAAIDGCVGVFHVASPLPLPGDSVTTKEEIMEPAVIGTQNVLNACAKAKVKKVVVVSSVAAVTLNPNWPKDQIMDEQCWSELEYCESIKNWYMLSKTAAEKEAWECAKKNSLHMITACPSLIIGPLLQPTMNASGLYILNLIKEETESVENHTFSFVDVRDSAESLLLVYENPIAEGRYICASYEFSAQDIVEKLKLLFPYYKYPKSFKEGMVFANLSSKKLQDLGWKFRPLGETLVDSVKNYEERGLLVKN